MISKNPDRQDTRLTGDHGEERLADANARRARQVTRARRMEIPLERTAAAGPLPAAPTPPRGPVSYLDIGD